MPGSLEGPEMPEGALSFDMLLYSNSCLFALPAYFSAKMSSDSFLPKAEFWFSNLKNCHLQPNWNLG